jgi:AcrR family transcriptional regulator
MRHVPQQTRSQQRVDLILKVTADLFAEIGYESATTNAIAERAEISIGSLYRYFPDKDAILRALTMRYFEELRTLYDEVFTPDAVYLPLPVLLDRLIDPFVELHCAYPAFKHILLGSDVSEDIATAAVEIEDMTTDRIEGFLRASAPQLEERRLSVIASVCKVVVKSSLTLLTLTTDQDRKTQITTEVKRLLYGYLEPLFGDV